MMLFVYIFKIKIHSSTVCTNERFDKNKSFKKVGWIILELLRYQLYNEYFVDTMSFNL